MAREKMIPATWNTRIPVETGDENAFSSFFSWDLDLPGNLEYFGQVYSFSGLLHVEVEKTADGKSFWVEMKLSCKGSVPCARCLKETPLEIGGTFRYFYTPSAEGNGQAAEDESTVPYPEDSVDIDLSAQIWESLVISLPEKALCAEECAGLCPSCGADLNLGPCSCPTESSDPRMQALRDAMPGVSED